MSNICKKSEDIIACVVSFMLAVVFGFNSPFHPWIRGEAYTDSGVFNTVALMMNHGYMPYKNSFDHKGPILYILNWVGNRISRSGGIWAIEIITIVITFYMMYKIARLMCDIAASVIIVLTSSSLLFVYYEGGNLPEEYAMPFIAIGIYIFLDYLKNDIISKKRLTISGLCCGTVLMLRPNMISVWVVYCIAISIILFLKKAYKNWLRFAIWFLVGVGIILIPIFLWLIYNDDFRFFIHDYIVFNMKYSSAEGGRALFSAKWEAFFVFFKMTIYLVAFFCIIFHLKNNKMINISYLVYLILTLLFIVMSGMSYGHYGMILIPAVVYPLGLVFSDIEKISEKDTSKVIFIVVSLYLLSTVIMPDWIGVANGIPKTYEKKDENHLSDITTEIINMIDQYTDESDTISVYGNWDIIYVLSDRKHATRYSYQFPVGLVMPEILDEYMASLQGELPKIVVIQRGYFDDDIRGFLEKNNYTLVYSSDEDDSNNRALLYLRQ